MIVKLFLIYLLYSISNFRNIKIGVGVVLISSVQIANSTEVILNNSGVNAFTYTNDKNETTLNTYICFRTVKVDGKNYGKNCVRVKSKKQISGGQYQRLYFETRNMSLDFKTPNYDDDQHYKFKLHIDPKDDTPNFSSFIYQFSNEEKAIFGALCKQLLDKNWYVNNRDEAIKSGLKNQNWSEVKQDQIKRINLKKNANETQTLAKRCLSTVKYYTGAIELKTPINTSVAKTKTEEKDNCHSSRELKRIQGLLKQLNLYVGAVDGIWGPGTQKAIYQYETTYYGADSKAYCIGPSELGLMVNMADMKLKRKLEEDKNRKAREEAKKREMECRVDQLDKCTKKALCDKSTVLQSGIRRWDLDQTVFWKKALELGLDCSVTIDKAPYSKSEAQNLLTQLIDYVQNNSEYFDINFALEFNKVRAILEGDWTKDLSDSFEKFRKYLTKYPQFEAYLEEKRKKAEELLSQKKSNLRAQLLKTIETLEEWGLQNILDEKAAEIYDLSERAKGKALQTINSLEQLLSDSKKLLNAINE